MAVSLDMDDELFFADLSRQVSLLINDDDDYQHQGPPISFHPAAAFQAFSTTMQSNGQLQFPCEQSAWKMESRGTGVFIPKSSNWRKKNKQRRLRSYNTIAFRQLPDNPSPQQVAQLSDTRKS